MTKKRKYKSDAFEAIHSAVAGMVSGRHHRQNHHAQL